MKLVRVSSLEYNSFTWCIAKVTLLEISQAFFLCVRQDPHHIDELLMKFNQGERFNVTGEVKFTNHRRLTTFESCSQ